MHFSTVFLVAALPFLASSSPAARKERGAADHAAKVARAFDFPDGCAFEPKFGNGWIDGPAGDGEGKSCFGFPNSAAITCGGPYDEKESNDLKEAVRQQATKDGQFEGSTVGDWTAAFLLFTTAYDDRDTSGFDKAFDSINVEGEAGEGAVGQLTYYWSRNGDYMSVTRSGCPGGLFDKKA
ncbi:MAG: hypothetical protein L6R39_004850 [Caloplaca ligustica]|nr:MAG: hypothetical protein L6R39_004850 [Caloplaca ligustica]